jgi:CRP-like cAMP-binding protein
MFGQQQNQNALLAALPARDVAMLGFALKHVELHPGVTVQEAGEPVERVYFPEEGLVSLQVVGRDGSCVEAGTVGSDGGVGLERGLGRRQAFTRAVVQIGGRFAVLPGERFERACQESPALRELLLRHSDQLCRQAQQIAACNASHTTEARLARWLLQRHDVVAGQGIPATQELLAQIFCVRRTTVTLIAHEMQNAGVIRYRRGMVHVVDRAALQEKACECYTALRPRPAQPEAAVSAAVSV